MLRRVLLAWLLTVLTALPAFADQQVGLYFRPNTSTITSPVDGQTAVFNTTTGQFEWWKNGTWNSITAPVSNFSASAAPTVSNDNTQGYNSGSTWLDTTHNNLYVCVSAATGAAVWMQLQGASAAASLYVPLSLWGAQGDLIVGDSSANTFARLPQGTNNTILGTKPTGAGLQYWTLSPLGGIAITLSGTTITVDGTAAGYCPAPGLNNAAPVSNGAGAYISRVLATSAFTDTTNASNITTGTLAIGEGGTGTGITPADGQILIGSTSTGLYLPANLTQGFGIAITNSANAVTIARTDDVQTASGTISSAQLQSLNTTPVQLIAAPGAGNTIQIVSAVFRYKYGTIAYGAASNMQCTYGSSSGPVATSNTYALTSGQITGSHSAWTFCGGTNVNDTSTLTYDNTAIYLTGPNCTSGDGVVEWSIDYRVVPYN